MVLHDCLKDMYIALTQKSEALHYSLALGSHYLYTKISYIDRMGHSCINGAKGPTT
jgi:hypothetical protein